MRVEDQTGAQVLTGWLRQSSDRQTTGRGWSEAWRDGGAGGLRFAFCGRLSTARFQHQQSSRAWQREAACEVISGHGVIVVEYFDVGCSRRMRWSLRPRAVALLAEVVDPGRGFDAIVVGEYERAFCGDQLTVLMPLLRRYGVGLWLPELGGPVDFADPRHRMVAWLGAQSQTSSAARLSGTRTPGSSAHRCYAATASPSFRQRRGGPSQSLVVAVRRTRRRQDGNSVRPEQSSCQPARAAASCRR